MLLTTENTYQHVRNKLQKKVTKRTKHDGLRKQEHSGLSFFKVLNELSQLV